MQILTFGYDFSRIVSCRRILFLIPDPLVLFGYIVDEKSKLQWGIDLTTSTTKFQQLNTKPWAPNISKVKPDGITAEKTNKWKNSSFTYFEP